MKYVTLQSRTGAGLRSVVLCGTMITHAELAGGFARTHTPISAGLCEFMPDGRLRVFGHSDSLNLDPAPGDGPLIEANHRALTGARRPRLAV